MYTYEGELFNAGQTNGQIPWPYHQAPKRLPTEKYASTQRLDKGVYIIVLLFTCVFYVGCTGD